VAFSPVRRHGRRLRQPWRWLPFSLRFRWARFRLVLIRHRVARRVGLVGLSAILIVIPLRSAARSTVAAERWGNTVAVVVAMETGGVGELRADAFELADRPAAFLPIDALTELPTSTDRLAVPVVAGDLVTSRHLDSTRGAPLNLEPDTRAVGVPIGVGMPPLHAGDAVDVVLIGDQYDGAPTTDRSIDAMVLFVGEEALTLAVAADDVGAVVRALTTGRVAVVLR
jgi:hypothetical protein